MPPIVLTIEVDDKGSPVIKQFAETVNKTSGSLKEIEGASQRLTASFSSMATKVALAGAAFLGFQSASVAVSSVTSTITGFDKEMANVNTVLLGSKVTIGGLQTELLRLPPAFGSATELAKGLYQAISAGIEPAKAVAFVGEQAKLASAGLTDLSTTVKLTTSVMDSFGLSASQASHISDVLFTVVGRGKTEFAPLAATFAQVFPLAKNMNLSFEETAATMTTLLKVFPSAGQAVTGFRGILSGVNQHLDEFKAAGINVAEVLGTRGVAGLMEELKRVTGGASDAVLKFIPEIEGQTAALALMGPQLTAQKENVQAFRNTQGAAADAFMKEQAAVEAAVGRITTAFERVILGGGLAPFFNAMLEPIEKWMTRLAEGGEASTQFATITVGALKAIVDGLALVTTTATLFMEGWNRIGQVFSIVADWTLAAAQGLQELAKWLGDPVPPEREQELARLRVQALLLFQSFDDGAIKWEAARTSLASGFATINASIDAASAKSAAFAAKITGIGPEGAKAGAIVASGFTTIDMASAETAAAIERYAAQAVVAQSTVTTSAKTMGTEVVAAVQQSVAGTLTFWEDGEEKTRAIFQNISTAGTRTPGEISTAFTKAGISTQDVLQGMANDALKRFITIASSGKATPQEILAEWDKTVAALNAGAFKKMPDDLKAALALVEPVAKKAGEALGKVYVDGFGNTSIALKEKTTLLAEAFQRLGIMTEKDIKGIITSLESVITSGKGIPGDLSESWLRAFALMQEGGTHFAGSVQRDMLAMAEDIKRQAAAAGFVLSDEFNKAYEAIRAGSTATSSKVTSDFTRIQGQASTTAQKIRDDFSEQPFFSLKVDLDNDSIKALELARKKLQELAREIGAFGDFAGVRMLNAQIMQIQTRLDELRKKAEESGGALETTFNRGREGALKFGSTLVQLKSDTDDWRDTTEVVGDTWEGIFTASAEGASQLSSALVQLRSDTEAVGDALEGIFTASAEGAPALPNIISPEARLPQEVMRRQSGGGVTAGRTYLVGERGPELFVPQRSGAVAPAMSGMPQVTYQITVHAPITVTSVTGRIATQDAVRDLTAAINEAIRRGEIRGTLKAA